MVFKKWENNRAGKAGNTSNTNSSNADNSNANSSNADSTTKSDSKTIWLNPAEQKAIIDAAYKSVMQDTNSTDLIGNELVKNISNAMRWEIGKYKWRQIDSNLANTMQRSVTERVMRDRKINKWDINKARMRDLGKEDKDAWVAVGYDKLVKAPTPIWTTPIWINLTWVNTSTVSKTNDSMLTPIAKTALAWVGWVAWVIWLKRAWMKYKESWENNPWVVQWFKNKASDIANGISNKIANLRPQSQDSWAAAVAKGKKESPVEQIDNNEKLNGLLKWDQPSDNTKIWDWSIADKVKKEWFVSNPNPKVPSQYESSMDKWLLPNTDVDLNNLQYEKPIEQSITTNTIPTSTSTNPNSNPTTEEQTPEERIVSLKKQWKIWQPKSNRSWTWVKEKPKEKWGKWGKWDIKIK